MAGRGAFLQRQGYYPSVLETAQKNMQPHEWDYWIKGQAASRDIPGPTGGVVAQKGDVLDGGSFGERVGKIACWNSFMREARYLDRAWRTVCGRQLEGSGSV